VPFQTIINKAWQSGLKNIVTIYDSACRFKVNAYERCRSNPHTPLAQPFHTRVIPNSGFMDYFVNAFHQHSHNPECADMHSLRNSSNVGMVSGEEIETSWAALNHLQYSIREMDAGARADMITTHMLHINKCKIQRMGENTIIPTPHH